jgi:hypothetical protein
LGQTAHKDRDKPMHELSPALNGKLAGRASLPGMMAAAVRTSPNPSDYSPSPPVGSIIAIG